MTPGKKNSYNSLKIISIDNKEYKYYSLKEAEKNGLEGISNLPKSLKVLLENLLRYEDDLSVNKNQINSIKEWLKFKKSNTEIAYRPARVLLQDYTGIPAVADLAAMREAVKDKNKDPNTINPLSAVDLVIDHSVQVDQSAKSDSFEKNVDIEFERNGERYSFLKWGQQAFNNFRIVPPGTGICHQVNLEYLSKVVWSEEFEGNKYLFPDTLVGTDSHTTMVNGLSVLGWGVGGIEAEAGMLGQPISMLIPEVIGFEVKNKMPEGTTATDLVLTVDYLAKAGLNTYLDKLGFNLVGYGCTTCIGNSGPLPENIVEAIQKENIYAVSVLSGNRNFEGRISPHIKANYLASPPLVVAYALAGHMEVDLYKDALGKDKDGNEIYLKDIWPSNKEIEDTLKQSLNAEMFIKRYSNVSEGPSQWQKIKTEESSIYNWDEGSTYVKKPPFFDNLSDEPEGFKEIKDARPLLILGDMVTTDHISPAGNIQKESPTGEYFMQHQILPKDYNSYGSRRGNHEVMMRGTFANIRIRNEMAPGTEGGFTKIYPEEKVMPVYDAGV